MEAITYILHLGASLRGISNRSALISILVEACKSSGLPSKLVLIQELLASEGSGDFVRSLVAAKIEEFTNALLVIWETYSLYALGSVQSSYEIPDAVGMNLALLFGTLGHHVALFPKLSSCVTASDASLAEQVFNALSDSSTSSIVYDARFPDFVVQSMLHMLCSFDAFPPRTATITRRYFRSAEKNVVKVLSRQLPNFNSSLSTYDAEGPQYLYGLGFGGGFPEVNLSDGSLLRPVQTIISKTPLSGPRNTSELSRPNAALLHASFWLLDRTIRRSSNDTSRVALATSLQEIIQAVSTSKIGLSLALLRQQDKVWPLLIFSCLFQSVWSTGRSLLFSSQPRSASDERIIDVMLPVMVVRVLDQEYCPPQVADALEGAIASIALPGTANFEMLLRQLCSSDVTSALEGVVMCATYLRASGLFLLNPVLVPSCIQPTSKIESEMPASTPSWIDALNAASVAAEAYPEKFPPSSIAFAQKIRQSLSIVLDKGCTLLDCLLFLLNLTARQSTYAVLRAGFLRVLRYVPDALGCEDLSDNIILGVLEEPLRFLGVQNMAACIPDPDSRVRIVALSTWIYIAKFAINNKRQRDVSRSELLVKFGFGTLLETFILNSNSNEELGALISSLSPTRQKEEPRVPVHTKALCDCAPFDAIQSSETAPPPPPYRGEKLYALFETSDQIVDEPVLRVINTALEKTRGLDANKLNKKKVEALTKIIEDASLRAAGDLPAKRQKF